MKKTCLAICLLITTITSAATIPAASQLASLLKAMQEEQSIHPDSLYPNILRLETRLTGCKDATEKAVTESALAYLYQQCAYTATAREYQSASDPSKIASWSMDDFYQAAARHYASAMAEPEVLHRAKIADWIPLLDKGKNDNIYANDMLMVVWRAAQALDNPYRNALPSRQSIIELYRRDKCREACLMLTLDSIDAEPQNKPQLLSLIDEYRNLSLCGAIYTKLSWCEQNDSARLAWLEEGLRKYPRYAGSSELKRLRQEILAPRCEWRMIGGNPYPGEMYVWLLNLRNVHDVNITVYKLKDSFSIDDYQDAKQPASYLKQNSIAIDNIRHKCTEHPAWKSFMDMLYWTAPEVGHYAIVVTPSTSMTLDKKVSDNVTFVHVSRLIVNYLSLPDKRMEFTLSDALSGEPVPGADITLYQTIYNKEQGKVDTLARQRLITDKDGKAVCDFPVNGQRKALRNIMLKAEKDGDVLSDISIYYGNNTYNSRDDRSQEFELYTDRSIYRPGQTVHLSGLTWERFQWDEHVATGERFSIKLCDTNGKEVATTEVTSDSLGVFSADFTLPESCLPGTFWFNVNGMYTKKCMIRVEEYKRPTFELLTDALPALQMPQDSITLTGRAIAYSGAPIRSARVVGTYRWTQDFWLRRSASKYDAALDTVLTDNEGRFSVRIPITEPTVRNCLSDGMMLSVRYEVTSPTGESHVANQYAFVSSKAVTLNANLPRLNDKDKSEPWSIIASSSTGTEVRTDVKLSFTRENNDSPETQENPGEPENPDNQGDQVCLAFTVKSGTKIEPTFLRDIPSGTYTLKMEAVSMGDTARLEREVVVFSQHDTRPVTDDVLWVYAPNKSFKNIQADETQTSTPLSPEGRTGGSAARIQLGSRHEAWIHYTLLSMDEVVDSRLIHLTDSIVTLDIPYEERYGDGLRANILCVKEGVSNGSSIELRLEQPDKELRHRWVTFRDKLQPGQKESWTLQLSRPDGSPLTHRGGLGTTFNLMATLYDSSLDAIAPHQWSLTHPLWWHINSQNYVTPWYPAWNIIFCQMPLRDIRVSYLRYTTFSDKLFQTPDYGMFTTYSVVPKRMLASSKASVTDASMGEASMSARNSADSFSTVETGNLQGKIAGLDMTESSTEQDDNAMRLRGTGDGNDVDDDNNDITKTVSMRENFQETAFFYPTLRSDANGNVTIDFTLPESMTTWRLLGLAHTQDMLTTLLDEKVVAQKDLMAEMHLPRFLRQGDDAVLPVSIRNISGTMQKGAATLTLLDAATEKVVMTQNITFRLEANNDTTFFCTYNVPENADMLICRWAAEGTTCSDGEQRYLPVLSNQEWVTDTRALTFAKEGAYTEDIASLFPTSATKHQLTIEYTSQPVWYAIQALPSLAWPKQNDVLSLAAAYYAGCLTESIAKQNPEIKEVVAAWKDNDMMQKSKLLHNEELKGIITAETPWINAAEQETERISRLCTLFDPATQNSLQKEYLDKLRSLQNSDGSFSWFPGMKGSRYMTLEVAYLLTRLKMQTGQTAEQTLSSAVNYIRHDRPTQLCTSSLRHLYIIYNNGKPLDKADRHNADSLLKVLVKHPEGLDLESRALAAIVLKKAGMEKDAQRYLESVKKFIVTNSEGLTYFEFPQGPAESIDRKLHIHTLAMEALLDVQPDADLLSGMQRYLLHEKRTTEWSTPVITTDAIFALLNNGVTQLATGCDATLTFKQKGKRLNLDIIDDKSGYIRTHICSDVTDLPRTEASASDTYSSLQQKRLNEARIPSTLYLIKTGKQESWGAIHAQYLAPAKDITVSADGDLMIEQHISSDTLRIGDRIRIRYEITAKRDFEYVALHAPRPACMEPVSQLSQYNWQNGLGYYRAVRDASTDFYFSSLPRGTYVIEEEVLTNHAGTYNTGIATIKCLYAPEFSAHSGNISSATIR